MKTVFKLCTGFGDNLYYSLYYHKFISVFEIGELSTPNIGLFYAFDICENLNQWIDSFLNEKEFKYAENTNERLYILKGTTSRVVSQFYNSIRHLPLNQLKDESKVREFWNPNHTKLSRELLLLPEAKGSILISNFTPVEVLRQHG